MSIQNQIGLVDSVGPYEALAAAVLATGLEKDGPDYVLMDCGRWWADRLGLEPDSLYRTAARGTPHEAIKVAGSVSCVHKPEDANPPSKKPGPRPRRLPRKQYAAMRRDFCCRHGVVVGSYVSHYLTLPDVGEWE